MKHNPKLHERVAALPGNARLHPLQAPRRAQGALELMWNLERALAEVSGLPHVSLQPSAGSHGELAGVLLTRAYHADRGDERTLVLTPDTAHGTNPATVTMAGYEVVKVGTAPDGGVDLEDLRAKADDRVACLMLTNPNTLGLFDPNIEEIARIVHDAGATLYYDGANLNAVMGISRPGDMGFDIVHFNLHKSFTQPHGGGGPGAGPIAVSDRIEPYLMVPRIVRREPDVGDGAVFDLDEDRPKSIGRLRGFQGNYGVFVRSYAYICSLGGEGLREASEIAVLNANYLHGPAAPAGPRAPGGLRGPVHARVRPLGGADEARPGNPHDGPRQADARLRVPPAHGLLPAPGGGGAAGGADRDRDPRDARGVRRGGGADPARGGRRPGDRPQRPLQHPGAAAGRGRRGALAGAAPAPDRRRVRPGGVPDARVVVLGGGPAGDVAALRAAQLGAETVLVERDLLGGTCVNRGCIPTKALLAGSELVAKLRDASEWGIALGEVGVNWPVMRDRAMGVAARMRGGVEEALRRRGVRVVSGDGWLARPDRVAVETDDGALEISAPTVIIATGSEPARLPLFDFEQPAVLTSTSLLEMETVPESHGHRGRRRDRLRVRLPLRAAGRRGSGRRDPAPRCSQHRERTREPVQASAGAGGRGRSTSARQVSEITEYRDDGVTRAPRRRHRSLRREAAGPVGRARRRRASAWRSWASRSPSAATDPVDEYLRTANPTSLGGRRLHRRPPAGAPGLAEGRARWRTP